MQMLWRTICAAWMALAAPAVAALDPATLARLAAEDSDEKVAAIRSLAAGGDARAAAVLRALQDDALAPLPDGRGVAIVTDGRLRDAVSGADLGPAPSGLETIVINNRVRGEIAVALAALQLRSADRRERLAAARALQGGDNEELLPVLEAALATERDEQVQTALRLAAASVALASPEAERRLQAARALSASDDPQVRQMLATMITPAKDGSFPEPDARVRAAAQEALAQINARLRKTEALVALFSGVSLGSILLLAALGLAITYGLMGIINMAHGEFLMLGAYATFVVQSLFRTYFPQAFDWYVLAALPVAFVVTAAVGLALERGVLRWLQGRPLETLLTTWGISLLLMQACRSLFGAQNVEVENPRWLSGGIALAGGYVLPYNRIAIIAFAAIVLAAVWLLIYRTRLGLFVRGVTQNRAMASCTGVPTDRVDMLTFALGSGVAGLGGVALSQIGNVGPDLGQSYIIDSFMVVVLGGVGQLAGTVIAALGLGSIAKLLEPWSGAVLAKIFVLLFIILFIQKRPQGLFALKGRWVEA
ncbi:MAG: urea ABC transporter permease subunit UrtB [Sutterellaceae bacterium]|nr:urea ABC transporter permease subunit UrtB [Burkholderiaceae bacterium]MDW8428937.1 urea ABC transporter permease subunit UrtB [Sutterellaceae bacterium]